MVQTAPDSSDPPLNPFESAFGLLKTLGSELQELRAEVAELRAAHTERLDGLDGSLNGFRSSVSLRFESLQKQLDRVVNTKSTHFETFMTKVDEQNKLTTSRLGTLDEALKNEVSGRLSADVSLDKKMLAKYRELLMQLDTHRFDLRDHKEKVEAINKEDRERHDTLRLDVEKVAALLSCNTLSRDPFRELGYQHAPPKEPSTDLGNTVMNSLPPLFGNGPIRNERSVLRAIDSSA